MDQSKLNCEGHSSKKPLKAGKKANVRLLAKNESLAEAGLSAFANLGGLNPINWPRRVKRTIVDTTRQDNVHFLFEPFLTILLLFWHFWPILLANSIIKHTPSTVTPCSLLNMAQVAKKIVRAKYLSLLETDFSLVLALALSLLAFNFWCFLKANKDSRKKMPENKT